MIRTLEKPENQFDQKFYPENRQKSSRDLRFTSHYIRATKTFGGPSWWLSLIFLLASTVIGFQSGLFILCNVKRCFTDDLSAMNNPLPLSSQTNRSHIRSMASVNLPRAPPKKQLVLIAVMTSKEFLTSRAPTVARTWATKVPGQVIFFSSEGSVTNDSRINLVSLPSVTDAYPPQKKSFLMMKYIYDHYLTKFEWFMRVDDDVYIRTENLEKLLRSIDNRKPYYIGQPGMGTKEEFGKLALGENENFCMGGPGIILSRETIARFVPQIKTCLKNFYTTHEDVELGRCVQRFANTSCTWSYEMQHILYNHPNKTDGYRAANLVSTDILRAVSLHSIKDTRVFTRVHNFALQRRIIEMEQRNMILRRQIDIFDRILFNQQRIKNQTKNLSKFIQGIKDEQILFKFKQHHKLFNNNDQQIAEQILALHRNSHRLFLDFNHQSTSTDNCLSNSIEYYFSRSFSSLSKNFTKENFLSFSLNSTENFIENSHRMKRSTSDENHQHFHLRNTGIYTIFTASQYTANTELPVRSIEPSYRQCIDEVVRTYMEEVNKISRNMGRFLEFRKTLYGYYKHQPRQGMNYILDLFLIYRKFSGKKMSVSVRKRVYALQKYRSLIFRELTSSTSRAISSSNKADSLNNFNLTNPVISSINNDQCSTDVPINMIVPVSGRLLNLKRLLNNFERVVLRSNKNDLCNVHLHIVLMETAEDDGERMSTLAEYIEKFINETQSSSRVHLIEIEGNFTRGFARSIGASRFNDTDLLFFIDLDMVFTRQLFTRIRLHTIFNRQVYFPIIFSQYDPNYWRTKENENYFESFPLRDEIGYWRQYGFGMLGIYKIDLGSIGNWNVEINGWGKEDVEIYDKLVKSPNLNVFRAIDTSLMHVFHSKICSPTLREDQLKMCKGTESITLGSQRVLQMHVRRMIELNQI